MDIQELEKKWQEIMKREFEVFMKEELGQTEGEPPACYKTGDNHIFCDFCPYRDTC
jgi:hypothetical protein